MHHLLPRYLVYKYKRLLQLISQRDEGPDLLLHLGDAVQHGTSEREWLKDFLWPIEGNRQRWLLP